MTTPSDRRRRIVLVWTWVAIGYLFLGVLATAAILRRDWSIGVLVPFHLLTMVLFTISAVEWHRDVRDFGD